MVDYTATDPLGSPRVLTNENGVLVSRRDFMPFGEEVIADQTYRKAADDYGVGDNVRQKFTGYERDEETGLDFAEARYYYNNHGRFTAVDPLLASGKSANPQTFNRYAYTMTRPLILTDPTGLQAGQEKVKERAKKVRVPKSSATVTPSAQGVFHPNNAGKSVSAEFTLTKEMQKDLVALKKLAYQLQFVVTKDNLNEAVNGRITPASGQASNSNSTSVERRDGRSASLELSPTDNKAQSGLGVNQEQTMQSGQNETIQEAGEINSGDASKAAVFDILTDEIANFAAKYEGVVLTGYTADGDTVRAVMEFSFFVEAAQREVALAREAAMENAIKSVPQLR